MTAIDLDKYRDELETANSALRPFIIGLRDIEKYRRVSAELQQQATDEEIRILRRRDLITSVLREMDNLQAAISELNADGYPVVAKVKVDFSLIEEFRNDIGFLQQAFSLFEPEVPTMVITFGPAEDKPLA